MSWRVPEGHWCWCPVCASARVGMHVWVCMCERLDSFRDSLQSRTPPYIALVSWRATADIRSRWPRFSMEAEEAEVRAEVRGEEAECAG